MGGNPFNEIDEGTFQEAQSRADTLLEGIDEATKGLDVLKEHHAREHQNRLEACVRKEREDTRFYPTLVRKKKDEEDDLKFEHVKTFDDLLEVHPDWYLRAYRAWDRRKRPRVERMSSKKQESLTSKIVKLNGRQVWALVAGAIAALAGLIALSEGLGGIILLPFLFLAWVAAVRLPVIYSGSFSGSSTRGTSGDIV